MTVGSKSTIVQTQVQTSTGLGPLRNGSLVNWSGADSAVKRKVKPVVKAVREVLFYPSSAGDQFLRDTLKPYLRQPLTSKPGQTTVVRQRPKPDPNKPSRPQGPRTEKAIRPNHRVVLPRERVPFESRPRTPRTVDVDAIAAEGADQTIFERANSLRLREIEDPPNQGDFDAPHAYTKTWTSDTQVLLYVLEWLYPNLWLSATGTRDQRGYGATAVTPPVWTAEDDYQLIARLRNKVVGSEFNLSSFLGAEGYDTLKFIGATTNRVYQISKAAKRLDFKGVRQLARDWGRVDINPMSMATKSQQLDVYKDLIHAATGHRRGADVVQTAASNWLQYQLAVRPLMKDVEAASQQLSHIVNVPAKKRIHASVTKRGRFPEVSNGPQWSGERFIRKATVAYYTCAPAPVRFLGLQDPEVVLWNAFPLTFVADYFLNIGGWLEARATAKAFPSGVYVTSTKNEERLTAFHGMKYPGKGYVVKALNGHLEKDIQGSFVRAVSSTIDVPKPAYNTKPLEAWQRVATVVSLAVSLLSGAKVDWGVTR